MGEVKFCDLMGRIIRLEKVEAGTHSLRIYQEHYDKGIVEISLFGEEITVCVFSMSRVVLS